MSACGGARLARALLAAMGPGEVMATESREWRSATFAGLRHRLAFVTAVEAGDRLARLDPERLRVPGQIVADLQVTASVLAGAGVRLTLEALTVHPC